MANHNSSYDIFKFSNSFKNVMKVEEHLKIGNNEIAGDYELSDIDRNQLTTNSEDLRNFSKEVREFVFSNPTQLRVRSDVKRSSCSSREGSVSIYDQIEEHQRLAINKEVNKRQEQLISSEDDNWGWIVVLGSLFCMIFVDGICFTYGLHSEYIKSYFALSDMSMSILPGSLLSGIYLITSPLANPLANYFGYRFVAMVGGICSTVSLFISSLCRSYSLFILFFGIFCGIGFGLVYLPAIAIVAHWFNQKRAVAIGIALCGSGIGTCILSFLLPQMIKWVHWNNSLILLSALCCQSLVAIALFRPYELHQRLKQIRREYKRWMAQNADLIREKKRLEKERKLALSTAKEQKRREKLVKKKQIVIKRGSIFTRIMEEKSRQRTVSTGSLDGMMITQMNQLVNASQVDMNGLMVGSMTSITNSFLPSNAVDRVIESTLKRLKTSNRNITKKKSNSISESNSMSKKSSANSISEMFANNENIQEDIPISLVKEYVAKQKNIGKEENTDLNVSGFSFKKISGMVHKLTNKEIRTIYLYEWKLGHATSEAAENINLAFFKNTTNERTIRLWYVKFAGDESRLNADHGSPEASMKMSEVELNSSQTVRGFAKTFIVSSKTTARHLKAVGSTTLINELNEPQKTSNLCISQSSVSTQSNKVQTLTPNTEANSDQVSMKAPIELPGEIKNFVHAEILKELDRPVNRKDLYFTGSLHQFMANRNNDMNNRYLSSNSFNKNNLPACPYSCPTMSTSNKTENEYIDLPQNNYNSTKPANWISDIFEFSIMKSCAFQMLILSSVTMMLGFFVPFFFIPTLLNDESLLWISGTLFAFGFSNILGRLVATIYIEKGWALKYQKANGANLTMILLGLSSVSIFVMPYVRLIHVSLVVTLALVYGFCIAMIVSIRSMLVVELFGVENLTKTFIFLLIFQGLAAILGPIVSGYVCDINLSFAMNRADPAFLLSGLLFFMSTICAFTLKRLKGKVESEIKNAKLNSMSVSVMSGQLSNINTGEYNPQTTQTTNLMINCE